MESLIAQSDLTLGERERSKSRLFTLLEGSCRLHNLPLVYYYDSVDVILGRCWAAGVFCCPSGLS